MKVRRKEVFEAEQYFHGKKIDRVSGRTTNCLCGCLIAGSKHFGIPHVHINSTEYVLISPGDWVVTHKDGTVNVLPDEQFKREFEVIS